jgi:hypothetical protein
MYLAFPITLRISTVSVLDLGQELSSVVSFVLSKTAIEPVIGDTTIH